MKSLTIPLFFLLIHTNFSRQGIRESPITDDSVKIIDNFSRINSIKQLLEHFKGKPVLIDLWATWCEPCLEEFRYADSRHLFLKKNGIEMIYVSFDKNELDSKWKKTITDFHLSGNHIRANKALQDALTILIWGGRDAYSIPHYVLFDKRGEVLDKNVPEPGEGSKFYDVIEFRLDK